ncbi:TPA: hypothetical protein MBF00_000591 [Klebsiella aerogenes]|nr:hypothetical protein [Klebsiella aerogenes]
MIQKQMLKIKWSHNHEGGAYYKDENGNCWYEFRNKLDKNSHIIIVDSVTRNIINYYNGDDPTMIGLFIDREMVLDVYQLDSFPVKSWEDFTSKKFKFENEKVIEIASEPVKVRTKEDIMKDLLNLQEELKLLK